MARSNIVNINIQTKSSDVKFLHKMIKIAQVATLIPIDFRRNFIIHCYLITLSMIYILNFVTYTFQVLIPLFAMAFTRTFLDSLSVFTQFIFSTLCLVNCCKFRKPWEKLIINIDTIDFFLLKEKTTNTVTKQKVSKFIFQHIIVIIICSFYFCVSYLYRYSCWSIIDAFLMTQKVYLNFFIIQIVALLSSRCKLVEKNLKASIVEVGQNRRSDLKIRRIKQMLSVINKIVFYVNNIFGMQILFVIIGTFIELINCFSLILLMTENGLSDTTSYLIVVDLIYCFISPVSKFILLIYIT